MIEALGISMVKNEADVIESFVRHNLGFMDALAMIDNDSADGTREILVQLQQEGLPIILFDDPVVAHFQAEIVTAAYRKVVPKFKPRFVFLLDADEFIVATSRDALYRELRAMRPGTQAQYCWRTYIPAPDGPDADGADPLRSITHRKVTERPWWKPIIATESTIDTRLRIQQGNHDVTLRNRSLPSVKLREAVLAHFPVRSVDQLTGKVLSGWIANLERNRLHRDQGYAFQWKVLYDRIVRGSGLTAQDLTFEALRYAQPSTTEFKWPQDVICDPVEPGYASLTVRPTTSCSPLQKVMKSIDKIFDPQAESADLAAISEAHQNKLAQQPKWHHALQRFRPPGRAGMGCYVDLPPFRYLADRYRPESVLEIGGQSSAYLDFFASQGARRPTGVQDAKEHSTYPDKYVRTDPDETLDLGQTFHLVLCVDVVGRVPPHSERTVIDGVTRYAGERIIFSGVRAGPPLSGPEDSHTISRWLDLFESCGWYPCLFDSLAVRSLSTFPWFSSNLMVLTRDAQDAVTGRARLTELERQGSRPHKRTPAVITHSFTDTATKLLRGTKGGWIELLRSAVLS